MLLLYQINKETKHHIPLESADDPEGIWCFYVKCRSVTRVIVLYVSS